jgi:hypothetical protein
MVKIAFHSDRLGIRGTSVALYDYANNNEKILGNESIIMCPRKNITNFHPAGVVRFTSRFKVILYADLEHMEQILHEEKCNMMYCIKYGTNDGVFSHEIPTAIHCVFDLSEPHGDVFAAVSEALADKYSYPLYVPHMIGLEPSKTRENMREELNIPSHAVVFGRYGGLDTFNIRFCHDVIKKVVTDRDDIYFVFINTPHFFQHPQIKYLQPVTTEEEKNRFICTTDAHLECGTLGHSFGLAIGEFSVNNKPIIAYKGPNMWNTAHFQILGNNALYFGNQGEFYSILTTFRPENYESKDNNCYKDYSPKNVMGIFNKVFIDPLIN